MRPASGHEDSIDLFVTKIVALTATYNMQQVAYNKKCPIH
jgi:hypothetical protein